MKIAFQGELGAYSEQALRVYFGTEEEAVPLPHLEDVFEAVESGKVDRCIVPVENSSAGSIYRTYDLLSEHPLNIIGEQYLKINHCLLALPDVSRDQLKKVYSHSQALDQSRAFLSQLTIEEVPFYDTAGSAAWIAQEGNPELAAVASSLAAEHYNLQLMAENIQTYKHNTTRFLVLSKEAVKPQGHCKTSMVFVSKHIPAALYKCLGGFATNNINLSKLESRPTQTGMGRYRFYLDCEGHVDDPALEFALSELEFFTSSLRILGSYPIGYIPE